MRTPTSCLAVLAVLGLTLGACTEEVDTPIPSDADSFAPTAEGTERSVVETDSAPEAVGPYSQAIQVGTRLYLAGQVALDPETGERVSGGIEEETRQVMENLGAVLEAAGFSFSDVVQAQVFLADLDDFEAMNQVYGSYFQDAPPPARATIQAAAIPLDALVEIMFIAEKSSTH